MCALTYATHRGAMLTVSVPLQESPHETATWAETRESRGHGIWPRRPDRVVLSCLTSILACPPYPAWLSRAKPSLSQNRGLRRTTRKHAYKSPVCIAPEGSSAPTPRSSRERAVKVGRLSWGYGNLSITTGVSVVMFCTTSVHTVCSVSLFWIKKKF